MYLSMIPIQRVVHDALTHLSSGALARQKGPRIAVEVGASVASEASL